MDRFKKLRAEIAKQKNDSSSTKTRYSKEIKIEVLRVKKILGLGFTQTAHAVGVTPKSIRDWCNDSKLKTELGSTKPAFKKLPVAKPKNSSVVLELKSGVKISGLSFAELMMVIKDEAS